MPKYVTVIYLINFLAAFILSFLILALLQNSSKDWRHLKGRDKIPLLGGIGFGIALLLLFSIYVLSKKINLPQELITIFIFAYYILILELIDDWRELTLLQKSLLQIILISIFVFKGKSTQIYFLPPWLNYLVSFIWIMGITNAFNLIDIKDSFCAGVSLIISLFFAWISFICANPLLANFFLILAGTLASFYFFNLSPAKMYMGNSGSHFLGFIFASLSMYLDYATLNNVAALFTPLIILAFPIIDTSFVVFSRIQKGISPFKKSGDHLFLRLISNGFSHRKALLLIYFITFGWGLSAIFILLKKQFAGLYLILALSVLSFWTVYKAREPDKPQQNPDNG
ncbi:MAG: hypothetical protein GF375_04745 [Candidatus Omnitrophica bacterium]|nr:hypothetical protein [Candidatus Omnitrophota bacterium]MBD3269335.1 hypothetical protein [Candidatus Omnitrophota bacterium]